MTPRQDGPVWQVLQRMSIAMQEMLTALYRQRRGIDCAEALANAQRVLDEADVMLVNIAEAEEQRWQAPQKSL
jgi:hypothetical protein